MNLVSQDEAVNLRGAVKIANAIDMVALYLWVVNQLKIKGKSATENVIPNSRNVL